VTRNKDDGKRVSRTARLQWVRLGDMRVNPMAQREVRPSWVAELVANFDPDKMQPPHVNRRGEHSYIMDGQHTVAACKEWLGDGWEDQLVQCWVYEGLTVAQEADLFDALQNKRNVASFDRFRVRVTAEHPVETEIDRVVRANGLRVSREKVDGAISCTSTLVKVFKRSDGPTLGRALRIIRDAYGDAGLEAIVVDGIGLLCERYNGQLDERTAIARLSSAHGGVTGLVARAEVLRRQTGNTKSHCVAAAATEIINRGRGGGKLPSWWKAA